jgi:enoyl-CoA hydratase
LKELADIERFGVTVTDFVAVVSMQSPPVNAQDRRFREECVRVFDVLSANDDVRVIVLTGGGGKAFSAGADLRERAALADEPGGYARHNRLVRASFDAVLECTKPVIAAVNGAAVGAGCVLALVCDILIVAEEAFLSMTEVDYGLAGGVRHLLRSFSPSDARLAIFTARRITGSELYRMNVASLCVPRARLMDETLPKHLWQFRRPSAPLASQKKCPCVTDIAMNRLRLQRWLTARIRRRLCVPSPKNAQPYSRGVEGP